MPIAQYFERNGTRACQDGTRYRERIGGNMLILLASEVGISTAIWGHMTKDVVKVVFRVWSDDGEIIALFPDIPADDAGHCTSYTHIEQHGAADYSHCIAMSRYARPEEYAALAEELRQIGYQLQIRERR